MSTRDGIQRPQFTALWASVLVAVVLAFGMAGTAYADSAANGGSPDSGTSIAFGLPGDDSKAFDYADHNTEERILGLLAISEGPVEGGESERDPDADAFSRLTAVVVDAGGNNADDFEGAADDANGTASFEGAPVAAETHEADSSAGNQKDTGRALPNAHAAAKTDAVSPVPAPGPAPTPAPSGLGGSAQSALSDDFGRAVEELSPDYSQVNIADMVVDTGSEVFYDAGVAVEGDRDARDADIASAAEKAAVVDGADSASATDPASAADVADADSDVDPTDLAKPVDPANASDDADGADSASTAGSADAAGSAGAPAIEGASDVVGDAGSTADVAGNTDAAANAAGKDTASRAKGSHTRGSGADSTAARGAAPKNLIAVRGSSGKRPSVASESTKLPEPPSACDDLFAALAEAVPVTEAIGTFDHQTSEGRRSDVQQGAEANDPSTELPSPLQFGGGCDSHAPEAVEASVRKAEYAPPTVQGCPADSADEAGLRKAGRAPVDGESGEGALLFEKARCRSP